MFRCSFDLYVINRSLLYHPKFRILPETVVYPLVFAAIDP